MDRAETRAAARIWYGLNLRDDDKNGQVPLEVFRCLEDSEDAAQARYERDRAMRQLNKMA